MVVEVGRSERRRCLSTVDADELEHKYALAELWSGRATPGGPHFDALKPVMTERVGSGQTPAVSSGTTGRRL